MSPWTLYFDGLVEPTNPGGTLAFGWAFTDDKGELITGCGAVLPRPENTNNVAEYAALYHGLKAVQARVATHGSGYAGLHIKGDSKLVVEQIDSHWEVKAERLKAAHAACIAILADLNTKGGPWAIEWIPREFNLLADELSRKAYTEATGKVAPTREKKRKGAA